MIGLWLTLAAWGAEAPAEPGPDALAEVAAVVAAVVRAPDPDVVALDAALARLFDVAADLEAPVDAGAWAALLLDLTLVRHALDRDWRAPRLAAAWARPDLPLVVGPSLATLRDWRPPPPEPVLALPYGREVWLDGRRRTELPELAGLHLVQGTRCGVWRSTLAEGDAAASLRAAWLADCPTPSWSAPARGLLVSGLVLVGVGMAAALGTYAAARPADDALVPSVGGEPLTPAARSGLVAGNVAGWTVAGVGAALVTPGAWLRAREVRRGHRRP
jgi:hypothetical protein